MRLDSPGDMRGAAYSFRDRPAYCQYWKELSGAKGLSVRPWCTGLEIGYLLAREAQRHGMRVTLSWWARVKVSTGAECRPLIGVHISFDGALATAPTAVSSPLEIARKWRKLREQPMSNQRWNIVD